MLLADTLIVIGLATVNLGTIQEADGPREHTFWLRNGGSATVTIQQGYTSCGCTTIHYTKGQTIAVGDSAAVTLRFNPRGKGGEFEETGTIVYGESRKRANIALVGTCTTSEETLMRQFPIRIDDHLRLSANRLDLGRMAVGETKERSIVVLRRNHGDSRERIPVTLRVDEKMKKGLQHIDCPVTIETQGQKQTVHITLDVFVK